MDDVSIKHLIYAIQGFSNDMTKQVLSNKLHISYSTLNRANKSKKWPRSIAGEAMHAVFDECRDRFFNGSGDECAKSVLSQLQVQGVRTGLLEHVLQSDGYDGFITELIAQARQYDPDKPQEGEPDPSDSESVNPEPIKTDLTPIGHLMAIPLVIVLLIGVLNVSLSSQFAWAAQHRPAFWAISICIAVAPVLMGVLVDSPLAWRTYKRTHPDAVFCWKGFARVAKYGDVVGIVPGAGRYDLTKSYVLRQPLCNVLGSLCYLSLFELLAASQEFRFFFENHEWVEFFKVGIAVAFFVTFGHMRDQIRDRDLASNGSELQTNDAANACHNPDNHLLTRAHVWANALHMVWALSLLIMLTFAFIVFSIATFRTHALPGAAAWPFFFSITYFAFTCASSEAKKERVMCVGILVPGVLALSGGTAALTIGCYLPSTGGTLLCLACVACSAWVLAWQRKQKDSTWLQQGKMSGTYSIAIASTLVIMLVIALLTSAFS